MPDLRMPSINRFICAGNLTRDPELKTLPSGVSLCKFGIAINKKYKTAGGEMKEETVFMNVTAWRGVAEWVDQNLHKGSPVCIEGSLTMDEWDDKTTGAKRTAIEISAEKVQAMAWDESSAKHGADGNYSDTPKPRANAPRARVMIQEPDTDESSVPF